MPPVPSAFGPGPRFGTPEYAIPVGDKRLGGLTTCACEIILQELGVPNPPPCVHEGRRPGDLVAIRYFRRTPIDVVPEDQTRFYHEMPLGRRLAGSSLADLPVDGTERWGRQVPVVDTISPECLDLLLKRVHVEVLRVGEG